MTGPFIDLRSYFGAWEAALAPLGWHIACLVLGFALGWWGCWVMVVHNNPGVNLKARHRAALILVRRGRATGDGGMTWLEAALLVPPLVLRLKVP